MSLVAFAIAAVILAITPASCFGTGIGEPLLPQLLLLGSTCVVLNTLVDVIAAFAADRLLKSDTVRMARARVLNRVSGFTLLGLGAYLALARREA
jgi:threonine/homoserine/homoserine lactone efflux protein